MGGICETCQLLSEASAETALASDRGWKHLTKGDMLARASSQGDGCPICTFILEHSYTDLWPTDAPLVLHFFELPPTAVVDPADETRSVFTHLQGTVRGPQGREVIVCRISLVCDPVANLAGLKQYIRTCQRHHAACSSATMADLPTRVLRIEKKTPTPLDDGQAPLQVRLVVTPARPGRKAPFLALSYCWGGQQSLMLERRNLMALQRGIDVDELSPTIRDAVWATRELDIEYLWVDALCIVQDDPADKDVEISRIAGVYRGATATIAAGTARAASEGFVRGPTIAGHPRGKEVWIAGRRGHLVPTPDVGHHGYTPEHPLDTRGWTLQESLLSERMLIFSDFEVLWQCQQTPLSSASAGNSEGAGSGGGGLNYVPPFDGLPYGLWAGNRDEQSTRFGTTDEEKLYLWRTIVEQYTRRNLSKPEEDRGPALQGIADALSHLWNDRYRYGSWNKFMMPLLAWVPLQGTSRDDDAERSSLAPTWSWISVRHEIIFPAPVVSESAVLLDEIVNDLRLSGEADVLVLDAKLFPAEDAVEDDHEQMSRHFDFHNNSSRSGHEGEEGEEQDDDEDELFYLFLGLTASTPPEDQQAVGLIVALVMDGVYERVGYMKTYDLALWDEYECVKVLMI